MKFDAVTPVRFNVTGTVSLRRRAKRNNPSGTSLAAGFAGRNATCGRESVRSIHWPAPGHQQLSLRPTKAEQRRRFRMRKHTLMYAATTAVAAAWLAVGLFSSVAAQSPLPDP